MFASFELMLAQATPMVPMVSTAWDESLPALGIGGVIAIIIFAFYRKDVKMYHNLWKGQSTMLVEVVKENTAAITKLTAKLDHK